MAMKLISWEQRDSVSIVMGLQIWQTGGTQGDRSGALVYTLRRDGQAQLHSHFPLACNIAETDACCVSVGDSASDELDAAMSSYILNVTTVCSSDS
jgi:hypothetical protein